MNTPFPYHVVISRDEVPLDPFVPKSDNPVVIYDGECDFEISSSNTRDGVLVGRYRLYIQDNTIPVEKGDNVVLDLKGRVLSGEVVDYFPTNFGLTVYWDNVNN
jgi:hypothetical protein